MKRLKIKYGQIIAVAVVILLTWVNCREKFDLPENLQDKNYLVVEGYINNGVDSTVIELSRTSPIDGNWGKIPEWGAQVWVESEMQETFYLSEESPGIYKAAPQVLNTALKYRLHISTRSGGSYSSSFVEVKTTPEIDAVSWAQDDNGVTLYVNTHDPENKSKYYAWNFQETWEFSSFAYSMYEYVDGEMLPRMDADKYFTCWQSYVSRNILIGSTARLSKDIVHQQPLTFIENGSWKLSSRYSILVKQRVLSKEAYEYLEKMKKSSEQLGSIFDPMPTTDRGNISSNIDPAEMVIGNVYVSTNVEKRIFIRRGELDRWRYYFSCQMDTIPNNRLDLDAYFGEGGGFPISPLGSMIITDYLGSSRYCMDCTQRGTNVRPDFW